MINIFFIKKKVNKNFEFIINTFEDLITNEFKCNKNEMVDNGGIFYFNGQNGSKFDWFENKHTSTLATLYPDGTEAVKVLFYQDGTVVGYYYKKGSMEPDNELSKNIGVELATDIAISLYMVSDHKSKFDKRLSSLDLSYNFTNEDIYHFYNDVI